MSIRARRAEYRSNVAHDGAAGPRRRVVERCALLPNTPSPTKHCRDAQANDTHYGYQCWHFDYGDQMYVMMRNYLGRGAVRAAWYGYVSTLSGR